MSHREISSLSEDRDTGPYFEETGTTTVENQTERQINDDVPDESETSEDSSALKVITPTDLATLWKNFSYQVFTDENGISHIFFDPEGQNCPRVFPINSREFFSILARIGRHCPGYVSDKKEVLKVQERLEMEAILQTPIKLFNRFATVDGRILIDLMTSENEVIEVTKDSWQITKIQTPIFRRFGHQLPLPVPTRGGNIEELFKILPLHSDEFLSAAAGSETVHYLHAKVKIICWILGTLRTGFPVPILLILGGQGSQKTTLSKMLRNLLDPSVTPTLGTFDREHLPLIFNSNAIVGLENVGHFNKATADYFCRVVTGAGIQKRKLYTDSDLSFYQYMRAVILNGIFCPSNEADFLDRVLLIRKSRPKEFRKLEDVENAFTAAQPRIFGALLDLLVRSMQFLESTPHATEFRMADFASFGRAVAAAMGHPYQVFDDAFRLDRDDVTAEILESEPWIESLVAIVRARDISNPWVGTSTKLLRELTARVNETDDRLAKSFLPRNPTGLSRKIRQLSTQLAALGISVSFHRTSGQRQLTLFATNESAIQNTTSQYLAKIKEKTHG